MAGSDTCFVLMPFGQKANPFPEPSQINFDTVYETMIEPAVRSANLMPWRADQEITSGLIHTAMFERLLLCEYAVADLTTANPNVYSNAIEFCPLQSPRYIGNGRQECHFRIACIKAF